MVVAAVAGTRLSEVNARRLLDLAWAAHAVALLGLLAGPVRFGFAPALSVTAWLVVTAYVVERQIFPQLKARWAMGGLGAVAVAMAWLFPGTLLHEQASAWLPLHWALGIASYGLFAAAVVHGWLMTRSERLIRSASEPATGVPLPPLYSQSRTPPPSRIGLSN